MELEHKSELRLELEHELDMIMANLSSTVEDLEGLAAFIRERQREKAEKDLKGLAAFISEHDAKKENENLTDLLVKIENTLEDISI